MNEQKRLTEYSQAFGYTEVRENWIDLEQDFVDPATAYLYRRAKDAGASYAYVFRTCPPAMPILPARPAVFVASAEDGAKADELHRKLYLLGNAPFVVVVLPEQVRVYTGFDYPQYENQLEDRFVEECPALDIQPATIAAVRNALSDFNANEIDTGRIWERQAAHLKAANRIDQRLLRSLQQLGDRLVSSEFGLSKEIAHNLIGKYIYIRYLKDRNILSTEWLEQQNISLDAVLGREATVNGLRQLVTALEDRFNGGVFPLLFKGSQAPTDASVRYVANIFAGDEPNGQLEFDFYVYDFAFIPIELLSSIYEQFLRRESEVSKEVEKVGAYYTPEPVADYLVSELNYVKPLQLEMRVLDPCCGSGIFLVLAYRRLIEIKKAKRKAEGKSELSPHDLKRLLTSSIYGVERNKSACYVTEFSLILTLLSYVDPPELHRYGDFKFPDLHNKQIFECDFFDANSLFWNSKLSFDWIIGNTPWVELDPPPDGNAEDNDVYARQWIWAANKKKRTVNRQRISDAFCWHVTDALSPQGCVGLYIPATSLTNVQCTEFRKQFFTQNTVRRITNFSNLAYILFAGRAEHPAATIVFTPAQNENAKPAITHYGPFVVNQVPDLSLADTNDQAWSITIYENEISFISPEEAATGESSVWKMALWGTRRDVRILPRLQRMFPQTLIQLCEARDWNIPRLGLQLRSSTAGEKVDPLPASAPRQQLLPSKMTSSGFHFNVPAQVLEDIPDYMRNVRNGGYSGLEVAHAPHLFLTINFAAYSDTDFILPNPKIGVSASVRDADYLRALSVVLSSSVIRYILFFQSHLWGISTSVIRLGEVHNLPVPLLTDMQVEELAALHHELSEKEMSSALPKSAQTNFEGTSGDLVVPEHVRIDLQTRLDKRVEQILRLPKAIQIAVYDFMEYRYPFRKGKRGEVAVRMPEDHHLLEYGRTLAHSLDSFVDLEEKKHEVKLARLGEVIICEVALVQANAPVEPSLLVLDEKDTYGIEALWRSLKQRFSQWTYIQRSLRIFDGTKTHLFKPMRLIDWTRTQALLDADDIIGEVLSSRREAK